MCFTKKFHGLSLAKGGGRGQGQKVEFVRDDRLDYVSKCLLISAKVSTAGCRVQSSATCPCSSDNCVVQDVER